MSAFQPSISDFGPIAPSNFDAIDSAKPPLSYWQDSWRRLKRNRRALISLWIVLSLLAFTLLGPLLWRVDPTLQVLNQISQGPGFGSVAMIVEDYQAWDPPEPRQSDTESHSNIPTISLVGNPSTEAVRLNWSAVEGATGYAVFRHELVPSGINDLGLPLAETDAHTIGFEDRLGLDSIRYYYSVIPLFAEKTEPLFASVEANVRQAITLADARYRKLIAADADITWVGKEIRLEVHPLGTDYLGRDMLARAMAGARTSLFIGIFAPLIYVLFGLFFGAFSGYVGGHLDNVLMRFADFVVALPFLLFMILFKIAFGIGPGESGIVPMLVAMVLLGWPATARLVRGQVLQIREEAYIQAAQLMGARPWYLLWRHLLPNLMGILLVTLTFAVPTAIFIEAFLSFIGMGVAAPTPSWGSMCNDGLRTMLTHPHELIVPAAFISITVLAFNLLGDGLRDALDARMRSA